MTAEQILACASPILFEEESEQEFPYYLGGSGFLVEYRSNTYFVTAKHCLENHKSTVDHLRIPVSSFAASREFLPFDLCSVGRPNNPDDPDCADFLILRVKTSLPSDVDQSNLVPFVLNDWQFIPPSLSKITALFARGYPLAIKDIDYDVRKIRWQAFMTQARYVEPDTAKHCYVLNYCPSPQVDDPNGMSGAPVVAIIENGFGGYAAGLAGMVIRGGKGSVIFRVIGAEVLRWALTHIVQ